MIKFGNARILQALILSGLLIFSLASLTARAVTNLPVVVIDDFEDGDASDWFFFGGNNAGGGGAALGDRPKEGSFYFSTGWGGNGTNSGFYGGAFRNFDDAGQIAPPIEPWFNVWVLNQGNATVDQYQLEITIREDLDGNGWTNGSEDSFRLDTFFTSAEFDDQWVLVSAPLSSFVDLGTGGDGTFNGKLDEVVIVVALVQGAEPSTVEVDFDQFAFTSGGPLINPLTVFDDMEHGDPLGNDWFAFNGAVGGGGINANDSDLPPSEGGIFSLETGWGSGGNPGFYGGFGRTMPLDLSGTTHFNFWINPNADQEYTLEINLQDDDNGDNAISNPDDDEFQYNCEISPVGPCAISGGGWQLVSIPLADFFDDNSFYTGGNGILDPVATANGGNGQLVNIIYAVIGTGTDANFRTDYWVFSSDALVNTDQIVDDFESGLPMGADGNGVPLGFYTFSDGSPIAIEIAATEDLPAPVPGLGSPNNVLAMTGNVGGFAGFIHAFENAAVDTWVPQDWSAYTGLSLWIYGQDTGTFIFIDVLDNRNPGSTTDDAERWTVGFNDDFSGWRRFEFPFADFTRKEVGNGAPNDGFGLTEIHGWALGTLNTGGEVTYYIDQAALYGTAETPALAVNFSSGGYDIEEGATGNITVKLNRAMNSDDPAQVSVDYASEPGSAIPGRDYTPVSGTLTFVNGGASELSFQLETFDNSKWEGTKPVPMRLSNPVDVSAGVAAQAIAYIIENDEFDPRLVDDFEQFPYLWNSSSDTSLSVLQVAADDPLARPGQDDIEGVLIVDSPLRIEAAVDSASCNPRGRLIPVNLLSTETFDAPAVVDYGSVRLGDASEAHLNRPTKPGLPRRHVADVDNDGDMDLIFHFRARETGLDCDSGLVPLTGQTLDGQPIAAGTPPTTFDQDFPVGRDWSEGESLAFWYYGSGSGAPVTVRLKDNRAPDPGPAGWNLVWAEEFNEPAGALPNQANWGYELGDGSRNGIPGWGNEELQYYTDDPENAATDGLGNMVLTMRAADGSLDCYYGPCEYTSARLLSKRRAEFAYGRIESRIKVPQGGGIWPAFWSLGTDIDLVGWPQTGEIDFMEFVGRLPNEIFGTIHGPGYSGGNSYGNIYTFNGPVYNDYHTFTVEWEPDLIKWYVDGILYHTAVPGDVAPNEWVFNDAVFLLLNVAIGGNFGGAIDPDIQLPQSMAVDYIRVFQGPDTAERFEASFVDDFVGWQRVEVPMAGFARSAGQPAGAPDDGLTLTEVWGYGFELPQGGTLLLDQVRVESAPLPAVLTVTNLDDSGEGSLRQALAGVAAGGTVNFDASLAAQVIALTSGQLTVDRSLTIDASAAPGVIVSGSGSSRVFEIALGAEVSMNDLEVADGAGAIQGGGILNFGTLNLDRVVVRDNTETSGGGPNFDWGGGGIYNGDGATLNLTDSSVTNNESINQPGGGVYGFFNSTLNITRSTISGNIGGDVAGGLRSLGSLTVFNSTITGNVSNNWHGGAAFITDGVAVIVNSTITDNAAPPGTAGGLMVATFGAPVSVTVTNSIVANNGDYDCQVEGGGAAVLNSGGNNVFRDGSCSPVGSDVEADPLLGPLADNGGPTPTQALLPGSPAIDAANLADCPATDQRGVARPQGGACDAGAYELAP